jgi:Gpi18-like mannosyltransferase
VSNVIIKRNVWLCLFKFVETRLLIIVIGAICYSIFPQRGETYQQKDKHEVINVKSVWDKFDSHWYQKLASEGYPQRQFTHHQQETWGYMPLYATAVKLIAVLFGGNTFYAGLFVSNICTLIALFYIYKLAQEKYQTGLQTVTLILTCAGSFYLSIVYSEGLFLLLTALVFYWSYKQRYVWALIAVGFATVTRIQGCLLFILPVVEIWQVLGRRSYRYIPAVVAAALPMVRAVSIFKDTACLGQHRPLSDARYFKFV